ncbi:MAG: chorismate mutase [Actinomycetota bacterium]
MTNDLSALRARIDELDRELLRVLAERLEVCHEVARVKERSDTPVIQPTRVRDVVNSRRQWAIDAGVDPDFAEQVMRVLLSETHRIEVAGRRPDPAPDKSATPEGTRSAIDTVASRIDHVVVAVSDVEAATTVFTDHLGFHVEQSPQNGIVVLGAGGVTIVLVGPEAGVEVEAHIAEHGTGIHHIAVEVLNADYARATLSSAGAPLLTDVIVDADGHEQFFTVRDPASGVQVGFVARTGHRVGVATANVLEAFKNHSPR